MVYDVIMVNNEVMTWICVLSTLLTLCEGITCDSYVNSFPKNQQCCGLSYLPLDKMATISQTIFWDAYSCMKSFVLWLKFNWSLLLRVQLTITHHWFYNGLPPNRQQAIVWTNGDLIHWCIYVALGRDELIFYLLLAWRILWTKDPCDFRFHETPVMSL